MTAFLHGKSKISFFPKKDIQNTNISRLSNSKAPSKVKVNDFTKHTPCDDYGNETQMAQGALQDFILHLAT